MRNNCLISKLILFMVLAGAAIVCANEPTAPTANIVILGDSLSAGYGIRQQESWPMLLQQKLSAKNYPYKVINASISGETSASGFNRIERILKVHTPAIVVLELGANDALRGLPISQVQFNLSSIIEKCREQGASTLLVGMQIPPNYGFEYTQKFRDSYAELAKMYRIGLVPFLLEGVANDRELMQRDNIHPRANAQGILLENIWPHLEKLLTGVRPPFSSK